MPNLDPTQVRVAGTGAVWKAPAGTVSPTDSTTAYGAAFVNLGYMDNGFTLTQDEKTKPITAWQTMEPILLIKESISKSISFMDLESDRQNLSLAFGDATVNQVGTAVGGAVTFAAGTTVTTATAHGLTAGAPIVFSGVTGSPGVTSGTVYFVLAVLSPTTFSIAATQYSTTALTLTAGTATGVAPGGPFSVTIPDTPIPTEYVLGLDWSHGTYSQRFLIPRAVLMSLPTIKYVGDDAVRFNVAFQILKPLDGSQSLIPLGSDWAATS